MRRLRSGHKRLAQGAKARRRRQSGAFIGAASRRNFRRVVGWTQGLDPPNGLKIPHCHLPSIRFAPLLSPSHYTLVFS
jgi:hypothetical protein